MFDEEYAYKLLTKTEAYSEKEFAKAIFSNNIDRDRLVKYCIKNINKEYYKQFNTTELFVYKMICIYFRDIYESIFYYDKQFTINLIKFYKYLHSISLKGLQEDIRYSLITNSVIGILSAYKDYNLPDDIFKYFIEDIINYSYKNNFKHYLTMLIFRKPIIDKFYKAGLKNNLNSLFKKMYKDVPYIAMHEYKELPYQYFQYYIENTEILRDNLFYRLFYIANNEDKLKLFKKCKHNLTIITVVSLLKEKLPIEIENEIISFFNERLGKAFYSEHKEKIINYPWSSENKEKLKSFELIFDLQT